MKESSLTRWPQRVRVAFLTRLAETGNVSEAANTAKVHRASAYRLRLIDKKFAAEWASALDEANDQLEAEARRRAVEGIKIPLIRAGKLVTDANGKPVTICQYNDRLLEFLLRAHRPETYRPEIFQKQKPSQQSMLSTSLFSLEEIDAEIAKLESSIVSHNEQASVKSLPKYGKRTTGKA